MDTNSLQQQRDEFFSGEPAFKSPRASCCSCRQGTYSTFEKKLNLFGMLTFDQLEYSEQSAFMTQRTEMIREHNGNVKAAFVKLQELKIQRRRLHERLAKPYDDELE